MVSDGMLLEAAVGAVQIPGESGDEQLTAEYYACLAHSWGIGDVQQNAEGVLLLTVDSGRPGAVLMLCGHMDTVGSGDAGRWTHSPYSGQIVNGKLFGRGASDMRGSLTAMVAAAADMAAQREQWCGRLQVAMTVCEEVLEGVALQELLRRQQPDLVIVGEATGLRLAVGQRGRAEIEVTVHGQAAHSAHPDQGINAADYMVTLLNELQSFVYPHDPLLGDGCGVVTEIASTPLPGRSVVPFRCRAVIDRRVLPGESPESVIDGYRRVASRISGEYGVPDIEINQVLTTINSYSGRQISGAAFFPAWKREADDPVVRRALEILSENGFSADPAGYSFCTDGSGAAAAGVPVLGFGPSHEELAHITDEYIEIEQLHLARRGFRALGLGLLQPGAGLTGQGNRI